MIGQQVSGPSPHDPTPQEPVDASDASRTGSVPHMVKVLVDRHAPFAVSNVPLDGAPTIHHLAELSEVTFSEGVTIVFASDDRRLSRSKEAMA